MKENRKKKFKHVQENNWKMHHVLIFCQFYRTIKLDMSKAFKFFGHGLINTLAFLQLNVCFIEANLGNSHSNQWFLLMQLTIMKNKGVDLLAIL